MLNPARRSKLGWHVSLIDPFAEADEDTGETKQSQNYIHIRIQRMYLPYPKATQNSLQLG